MTDTPATPDETPPPAAAGDLLQALADLTGLFNPEQLWQEEEKLDDLSAPPPAAESV